MSKFVTGHEIIQEHGIRDFEFYNDYVQNGLMPHNHIGQSVSGMRLSRAIA